MKRLLAVAALSTFIAQSSVVGAQPLSAPPVGAPDEASAVDTPAAALPVLLVDEAPAPDSEVPPPDGALAADSGALPPVSVAAAEPFMLQPTILGELDYRVYPSEAEGNTGFALARLRPGLVFTPVDWFRAVATMEFAGEHPAVLDAYARFRAAEWAQVTVGYSKPPLFASFVYDPVQVMPFPDRAPVVSAFRVRRDLGVDVHFAPRTVRLEGWLRVGNGTGSALGNDNALPAGYAALDLVLGRAWVGAPAESQHLGLRLGAALLVESPRDRSGIAGQTPLGFTYYRPPVVSGLRVVSEAHAVAYAGPLRFTVEGAMARESRSRDDDGNPSTPRLTLPVVRSYGVTAELSCVLLGGARAVGHAPQARTDAAGAWRGGALEVALRYDGLWLAHSASDVLSGGSQGGALALKWWPMEFLAATLAGYITHYDTAPIDAPGERWSWGSLARLSFFWGPPSRSSARAAQPAGR